MKLKELEKENQKLKKEFEDLKNTIPISDTPDTVLELQQLEGDFKDYKQKVLDLIDEEDENRDLRILDSVFGDFKDHQQMNNISEFLRNNLILRGSHYGKEELKQKLKESEK